MKTSPPSMAADRQRAFTCTELMAVFAGLVLLSAVVLPALANHRPRSAQIICANNLRQIGIAQQLWGNDHNDLPPLMVPVNEGGTRAHSLAVNAWIHFAWLSNELASARLMFCPSDTGRPAQDFTANRATGYLHANFGNQATSYFTSYSSFDGDPLLAIMNGDRNITVDGTSTCSLLNVASSIQVNPNFFNAQWTTNLHNLQGNTQFRDGRVEMLSATNLRAALVMVIGDNSSKHIAIPR